MQDRFTFQRLQYPHYLINSRTDSTFMNSTSHCGFCDPNYIACLSLNIPSCPASHRSRAVASSTVDPISFHIMLSLRYLFFFHCTRLTFKSSTKKSCVYDSSSALGHAFHGHKLVQVLIDEHESMHFVSSAYPTTSVFLSYKDQTML